VVAVLSKEKINRMIYLKTEEQQTDTAIAKLVGVSRGTVIKYLKDNLYIKSRQNEQFVEQYKEIKKKEAQDILDIVRSEKYSTIASNIVDLFDKEALKTERDTRGLRGLTALLGNTIDKTLELRKLDLAERKMIVAERTLELKEEELRARIDNPEAFASVTIINDANEYKKEQYDTAHTN